MIIQPKVGKNQFTKFVNHLEEEGVTMIYADPKNITNKKSKIQTVYTSSNAKYVILDKEKTSKIKGKKIGRRFKVLSNKDIDKIFESAKKGLDFVIIEVKETLVNLGSKSFELKTAKVLDIQEVGDGERVCVDTASMLHKGEGMLIGSRANFMFLVHNESVGSSFTSPRPFRVNAGAVHCYTLSPDGTTKYLSELETGSEVLILNSKGKARRAAIGRCKIERRPMLMIKAKVGDEVGGIIAQDAETIRFVKSNGQLVSVTHLKKGDSVLAFAKSATGRHFGMEVSDEYILEK